MRKRSNFTPFYLALWILFLTSSVQAQLVPWYTTGNTVGATDYFGANAGSGNPLELRVYDQNDINFYTDYTNTTTPRVVIAGNSGATNGFVGIGTATPVRLLHLHSSATTPAVEVLTRYSNPNTATFSTVGGLEVGIDANGTGIIRHQNDELIEIWTTGTATLPRAVFTNANFFGTSGSPGTLGAGLRILDPDVTPGGDLDIWTSTANQTHIVWGPNGRIQGINDRFEIQADFTNGLWFNVANAATGTFFNRLGQETGRIGANTFWRIGANATGADAARRLEVVDGTAAQLRLTNSLTPLRITDFETTGAGNLLINPSDAGVSRNVGINLAWAPFAKLEVNNTNQLIGTASYSTSNTNVFNIGVWGYSQNAITVNAGVVGNSPAQITFAGVPPTLVIPTGTGTPPPTVTIASTLPYRAGVIGRAEGSLFNYGGIFESNSCQQPYPFNIGVYASARYGQPFTPCRASIAGYFQGHVLATGMVMDGLSDANLKDSIAAITGALSVIESLQPKSFVYKTSTYPNMNMSIGRKYGLIAQQVDTILPGLVMEFTQPQITDTAGAILQDTMTFKAIHYSELIPLTIAAIQEQQTQIEGKVGTCSLAGSTPPNYLPKWDTLNRVLCNSQVYDNGIRVGIPTTRNGSYFNVANTTDTVTATFSSTTTNTTAVVSAVYNTDSSANTVAAVMGYSKYVNEIYEDAGWGGRFTGGEYGVYGLADGANATEAGVVGEVQNAGEKNIGVMGRSKSATSVAVNIGTGGFVEGSDLYNAGLIGVSHGSSSTASNFGVGGFSGNSAGVNVGGYFEASDTVGSRYGVFAYADGSAPGAYAGYFDGDVHATGTVTWSSDVKLKDKVKNVEGDSSLALIMRLQPKSYLFRTSDYPYLQLPKGHQYGLLAQEVEQVLPDLVKDVRQPERRDADGRVVSPAMDYKGLNYTGLIPLLVGAVKEQQNKIDSLSEVITDRLTALEARLNGCCGTGAAFKNETPDETANNKINVELTSMQVIVLEQNVPNPFAEQTSISYYLPESIAGAQIVFTDILGNTIKTDDVKSGYGVVTVFAANLSSGQYSYSLIVNGKVVETKRMVKQK